MLKGLKGSVKNEARVVKREAFAQKARVEAKAKLEAKVEAAVARGAKLNVAKAEKAESGTKLEAKLEGQKKEKIEAKVERKVGCQNGVASLLQRANTLRALAEAKGRVTKTEKGGATVKKEKRKKSRKGTRKRKATAAVKRARREAINREVALSPDLARLLGAPALSRPETVKRLWAYCRNRGMLNPEDKRELVFDGKLRSLLGAPSARIFELMSLLTPHFDYTQPVTAVPIKGVKKGEKREKAELASKVEAGQKRVLQQVSKKEEILKKVKLLAKADPAAQSSLGASPTSSPPAVRKREMEGTATASGNGRMKAEPAFPQGGTGARELISAEAVASCAPRLFDLEPSSVCVHCLLPPAFVQLGTGLRIVAVAAPAASASAAEEEAGAGALRFPCRLELEEGEDGQFEPRAEALAAGLDPALAYRVSLEVSSGGDSGSAGSCGSEVLSTRAVQLPQRARPASWTAQEVGQWCAGLRVRQLAQKVRECGINGETLLTLEEEDLQGLGLTAPFLLRRVLSKIGDLRQAAFSGAVTAARTAAAASPPGEK